MLRVSRYPCFRAAGRALGALGKVAHDAFRSAMPTAHTPHMANRLPDTTGAQRNAATRPPVQPSLAWPASQRPVLGAIESVRDQATGAAVIWRPDVANSDEPGATSVARRGRPGRVETGARLANGDGRHQARNVARQTDDARSGRNAVTAERSSHIFIVVRILSSPRYGFQHVKETVCDVTVQKKDR